MSKYTKPYSRRVHGRTKDRGVTREEIIKRLNIPRTIPDLKWHLGSFRAPMDVTIETALRNMLKDGIVEVIDEPRHCYQAARYRIKKATQ